MQVVMRSMLTGKEHRREIDVTEEDLVAYRNGTKGLIQQAFPNLSADDREFLMTGITPEEWDEHIKSDEDEDEDVASVIEREVRDMESAPEVPIPDSSVHRRRRSYGALNPHSPEYDSGEGENDATAD